MCEVGEYIGSGGSIVSDLEINVKTRWTLFEAQSETICQSNLFKIIRTDDDAKKRNLICGLPLQVLVFNQRRNAMHG